MDIRLIKLAINLKQLGNVNRKLLSKARNEGVKVVNSKADPLTTYGGILNRINKRREWLGIRHNLSSTKLELKGKRKIKESLPKSYYTEGESGKVLSVPQGMKWRKPKKELITHHELGEKRHIARRAKGQKNTNTGHISLNVPIEESNVLRSLPAKEKKKFKNWSSNIRKPEQQEIQKYMPKGVSGKQAPFEFGKTKVNRRMKRFIEEKRIKETPKSLSKKERQEKVKKFREALKALK